MKLEALEPHGPCDGVRAAIDRVVRLCAASDSPVYCLHAIVHSAAVTAGLRRRGVVFVESPDEVPVGATAVVSAHGVSPAVRGELAVRSREVIDATCPRVAAAHQAVRDAVAKGLRPIVLGHREHVEVKGLLGESSAATLVDPREEISPQCRDLAGKVALVAQTSLDGETWLRVQASLSTLGLKVESTSSPCPVATGRQRAVRDFVARHGSASVGVLVLTDPASSNGRRLYETAMAAGVKAWAAVTPEEVRKLDFAGVEVLGVTSSASLPDENFEEVLAWLSSHC